MSNKLISKNNFLHKRVLQTLKTMQGLKFLKVSGHDAGVLHSYISKWCSLLPSIGQLNYEDEISFYLIRTVSRSTMSDTGGGFDVTVFHVIGKWLGKNYFSMLPSILKYFKR
jgi:hypothetical protein